ncbi:hypothetical protein Hanom_Chr02g00114961 [Helianthus anomalus]
MVRFGERGKVKAPDCRVSHALLYGSPRLSWRQIMMINTWDTRESCTRMMIPYVQSLEHQAQLQIHWDTEEAGLPYVEHSVWTDYSNLPIPRGPSDPSPHWPEAVGSSFIPPHFQPPAEGESGTLDNYREMFEALTGYPYNPNPLVNPNERFSVVMARYVFCCCCC